MHDASLQLSNVYHPKGDRVNVGLQVMREEKHTTYKLDLNVVYRRQFDEDQLLLSSLIISCSVCLQSVFMKC